MSRTAKLEVPFIPYGEPLPLPRAASASAPDRPATETAAPPGIDNELVSELETALEAVLARGVRREQADPEQDQPQLQVRTGIEAEAVGDIWYGPTAAEAGASRPLLVRPAELPEARSAFAREHTAPAEEARLEAPRRRGLLFRAALCLAGVLGVVGLGSVGLTFLVAPAHEEPPLLAKAVKTETIRAEAATDRQPEVEPGSAGPHDTAAGATIAETPAASVALLRPVGDSSSAATQPAERRAPLGSEPRADTVEPRIAVKTPDRLATAAVPAPDSEVASGPQESQVRVIPPAATPPAAGLGEEPASRPAEAAGEDSVAAEPAPLSGEELVARSDSSAEAGRAGPTAPAGELSADEVGMTTQPDLETPATGQSPAEAEAVGGEERRAPVTAAVNMRAGPDNDAAVLTVVPAGGEVQVIACEYWCEVVFAGERGWIYKSFLRGVDS